MREREEKEAAERRAREKEEEERRAREEEEEAAAEAEVVPLLPREEIFRRLRRLNQPVILFGETDHQVRVACRVCRVCASCASCAQRSGGLRVWRVCRAMARECRGSAGCCSSSR